MQFLKILFWCLLAFLAAIFTLGNWTTVPIKLWGGLIAEINLPLLLFATFAVGFLPTMFYYSTVRWRLRQRLAAAQRAVSDLRDAITPPARPALLPDAEPEPSPPVIPAAPVPAAIPPAVA